MASSTLSEVEANIRAITSSLFVLMVQATDSQGAETQRAMTTEIKSLISALQTLTSTSRNLRTQIPFDLVEKFIEQGRNPDIYTRDLVEEVMRSNQRLEGQAEGFAAFRDLLGEQIASAVPEMRGDVRRVVGASGGERLSGGS